MSASVRQRLLNLRGPTGESFNALLTQYAIERFLYRLSKSPQVKRYVLKGAMLFRVWNGKLHRPTKDLDLLGTGEPSPESVIVSIRSILGVPAPDDGLSFDPSTVTASAIREGEDYGGIRVKLVAMLGKARIPMQIDIGFGDAVTPRATLQTFPTLLGMNAPRLRMCPQETMVAEKLEVAVTRGLANTRMKDFYDLLSIFRTRDFNDDVLAEAVAATFRRRQTTIPETVPAGLSDQFGKDADAGRLWREFLRRLEITDAPEDFSEVVREVRGHAWPILKRAMRDGAE